MIIALMVNSKMMIFFTNTHHFNFLQGSQLKNISVAMISLMDSKIIVSKLILPQYL